MAKQAKPTLTPDEWAIIVQCIEVASFQGNSVRAVAALLDKIDVLRGPTVE